MSKLDDFIASRNQTLPTLALPDLDTDSGQEICGMTEIGTVNFYSHIEISQPEAVRLANWLLNWCSPSP